MTLDLHKLGMLLSLHAQMSAINAEVEGMKAENASRLANGESPAYVGGHFTEQSQALFTLSVQLHELAQS